MSQKSNTWIIGKLRDDDTLRAMIVTGTQTALLNKVKLITTNDQSSTTVTLRINGVEIVSVTISNSETDTSNPLPFIFMTAINMSFANWPTSGGYWEGWIELPGLPPLPALVDNGDGTMTGTLPSGLQFTIVKHSFPIEAYMDPADGITQPGHLNWPQYPDIIIRSTEADYEFTVEMDNPYASNPSVMDPELTTTLGPWNNEIIIAEPEDRPPLLNTQKAIVVLRPESESPNTQNSQGGDREETIYIEVRSWTKQTVHDLKERILAVLEDIAGALPSGGMVYRVRHDWNRAPYKNADGVTWECQIRYVVWYR